MGWAKPEYEPSEVDEAGQILIAEQGDFTRARTVINNWRSSHAFPLNTFQMNLRAKTRLVSGRGLVAQRIKRLPAIRHKLERMPHLRLSRMQDIGGCRAVVPTVANVRALRSLYRKSQIKHKFLRESDYISTPKDDGYRSVHLVYRYHSDRTGDYEGLRIELQLRTQVQHAWATAVETVGQFRQEMLKSDEGDEEWLRFFPLMGTAIALREGCPPVPNTPISGQELTDQLNSHIEKLDVINQLTSYQTALSIAPRLLGHPDLRRRHYFILRFDPAQTTIAVTGYRKSEVEEASRDYQSMERTSFGQSGPNVVLVSVDTAASLRRAYPNFFLDTRLFLDEVRRAIRPRPSRTRASAKGKPRREPGA